MPTIIDATQRADDDQGTRAPLTLLLARPRGFCAGVDRAVEMLDLAVETFGPPIYARHAIVHNPVVVADFEARGVIFVERLSDVPAGAWLVVSAHGAAQDVFAEASARGLRVIDTTCPLVSKVHAEVRHHFAAGRQVLLVGHAGHPEVLGTMGQSPAGSVHLVPDAETAARIPLEPDRAYGLATQTTLSVRDVADIKAVLRARLPRLVEPAREDICYATTNRQAAVAQIARRCDAFVVIGGYESSNSRRLVETARDAGCPNTRLIERPEMLDMHWLAQVRTLGLSSGASTPETSVADLCDRLRAARRLIVEDVGVGGEENVRFGLPPMFEAMAVAPRSRRAVLS